MSDASRTVPKQDSPQKFGIWLATKKRSPIDALRSQIWLTMPHRMAISTGRSPAGVVQNLKILSLAGRLLTLNTGTEYLVPTYD